MNTSQKCNCCFKEDVCKYKKDYQQAIDAIMECNISNNNNEIVRLREAKFVEVSIKCPFMSTSGTAFRGND